jgi:hypothetical protein
MNGTMNETRVRGEKLNELFLFFKAQIIVFSFLFAIFSHILFHFAQQTKNEISFC